MTTVEEDRKRRRRSTSRSRSAERRKRQATAATAAPTAAAAAHEPLAAAERAEAERIARIAQLAEERAAQRALAAKQQQPKTTTAAATTTTTASNGAAKIQDARRNKAPIKLGGGEAEAEAQGLTNGGGPSSADGNSVADGAAPVKVQFRSKAQRQQEALARLEEKRRAMEQQRREAEEARRAFLEQQRKQQQRQRDRSSAPPPSATTTGGRERPSGRGRKQQQHQHQQRAAEAALPTLPKDPKDAKDPVELMNPLERQAIKDKYLGKVVQKKKVVKASEKFAKIFQFDWEATEDTSTDLNPLYAKRLDVNLLYGRGYRAGVDMREQRKHNSYLTELAQKRQREQRLADETNTDLSKDEVAARQKERERAMRSMHDREREVMRDLAAREAQTMGTHWSEKPLAEMKERDWRIFREDFDITIKGGRAPNPLRKWEEAEGLPEAVFKAIRELGFERPSPIQMQAIPIGLQRRDIIGIAETGSGKTAAFVIPLISYLYSLPPTMIARTPEQGPLALVMAPTRELALQIEQEAIKLCKYTMVGMTDKQQPIRTLSVVGGQSIEDQAFKLRQGIDIIIGTPGRLMDCMESHYLVLNQCNYVVLDEADRMIDMGFEPQVVAVLENMGSLLKSENEEEMEQQLTLATTGTDHRLRVTTMFSATMPTEVERLAKTFLRHPAIVKIGDEDSGKNKRIDQRVMFMKAGKKKPKLMEMLGTILSGQTRSRREKTTDGQKIIVFVNVKKECDVVAKAVSAEGFRSTILHGGKSQDQREESLKQFREGYVDILVATDVAGRGLDIPDVTHVINYDLPSKIQNYCHRIGRTGRAGKDGVAISFLTDEDEEIMYDLKQYLISTSMPVPSELASHPSAKAAPGTRDEKGNIIGKSKRDGGGGGGGGGFGK